MSKRILKLSGFANSKPIYKGIYRLYETHGIPLDIILTFLRDHNAGFDVLNFFQDAMKAGKNPISIRVMLENAALDSGMPEEDYRIIQTVIESENFNERLNALFTKEGK